jgi:hypothetical protein
LQFINCNLPLLAVLLLATETSSLLECVAVHRQSPAFSGSE